VAAFDIGAGTHAARLNVETTISRQYVSGYDPAGMETRSKSQARPVARMTPSITSRRVACLLDRASSDPDVPLVAIDLASVESYLLVRPLSYLAVEQRGALWCPLISKPASLDLDVDAARSHARRMQLPFVRPARHPAPVPTAMRIAALAAARSCAAIFTVRTTRLGWSTGADLDRLELGAGLDDPDDDPEGYLRLMMEEIGVDVRDAKRAARDGSEWDLELHALAGRLARLGIHAAPTLRWRGELYTGLADISSVLAD
jgi:2-hydroxychromene-2-carboxylate isomerase